MNSTIVDKNNMTAMISEGHPNTHIGKAGRHLTLGSKKSFRFLWRFSWLFFVSLVRTGMSSVTSRRRTHFSLAIEVGALWVLCLEVTLLLPMSTRDRKKRHDNRHKKRKAE
eukprot:scaffold547844_cov149-Attheya_sp.AAC.1